MLKDHLKVDGDDGVRLRIMVKKRITLFSTQSYNWPFSLCILPPWPSHEYEQTCFPSSSQTRSRVSFIVIVPLTIDTVAMQLYKKNYLYIIYKFTLLVSQE